MLQTFTNLPEKIIETISNLLAQDTISEWVNRAEKLHVRYMEREKDSSDRYIRDYSDVLAYLALRVPATYAQICGALGQVKDSMGDWSPKNLLDIGSGPGTGVWAAKTVWPGLEMVKCIDQEEYFVSIGQDILQKAELGIHVSWIEQDLLRALDKNTYTYDVVLVANVLNELNPGQAEDLLNLAYSQCRGVMIIVEPGTQYGFELVNSAAQKFSKTETLIAPYVENTFIESKDYWIHFPQRFIRPEFQKRIRQHMRDSSLMPSDFEESKYAYCAIGRIPQKETVWGRCIGPIEKQKGFLTVPCLTKEGIINLKVLKRNKEEYNVVKNLKWGETIQTIPSGFEKR